KLIYTKTITEQLYSLLKNKIINNEIYPGQRIDFEQLVKDYNVSKTPLKSALEKLEFEGFITIKARSGTYVSVPTLKQIIETYDVRQALEWQAINLSFNKIPQVEIENLAKEINEADKELEHNNYKLFFKSDIKFHELLYKYSDNCTLI